MMWMLKLGEDCTSEDYLRMIENRELDNMVSIAATVVDQFMERFPTVPIDTVVLTINKDATVETKIFTAEATPGDNVKIEINGGEIE